MYRRRTEKQSTRAEAVHWRTLVELNGYNGLRENGQLRPEGKDAIVQDGDAPIIRRG